MPNVEEIEYLEPEIEENDEDEENEEFVDIGLVITTGDGVAKVSGLEAVQSGELVSFESGVQGIALNLEKDFVRIAIFGDDSLVSAGDAVYRSDSIISVATGPSLLGRVVDSLGNPIDQEDSILEIEMEEDIALVEVKAPGIIDRQSVNEPVQTGIVAVDSMIPIGRGQRELIIGDRQTGKTAIVLDTIINQQQAHAGENFAAKIYCIYVAVGQKRSTVAQFV